MQLKGKNVFITGAAQGLGQGISDALLQKGAKVCIADINTVKGNETVKTFQEKYGQENVSFLQVDVTNEKAFEDAFNAAISRLGHIDIMMNNAGIMDESKLELTVNLNFLAVARGTNLAIKHMNKLNGGKGGLVINTASTAGFGPGFWFPAYVGTKYAVIGYTMSWAANPTVSSMGINFGCLCPSAADTALLNLAEGQIIMCDHFINLVDNVLGRTSVSQVAEGCMTLLEKDDNNGALMVVGKSEGTKFVSRQYNPSEELKEKREEMMKKMEEAKQGAAL